MLFLARIYSIAKAEFFSKSHQVWSRSKNMAFLLAIFMLLINYNSVFNMINPVINIVIIVTEGTAKGNILIGF